MLLRKFAGLTLVLFASAAAQQPRPAEWVKALSNPKGVFWSQASPDVYTVRIETTKGTIVLKVMRSLAPIGADRFYHLVQTGFYDDSRFFRVIKGRFAQFGIPGDPSLSSIWRKATIPDDPVHLSNVRGTFAYAMTGPNARTTQIYINTDDQTRQDGMGFAPFGQVVEGMEVVEALYSGYGESSGGGMRAGHQGRLFEEGNTFLDRDFPLLDKLLRCVLGP